MGHARSYMSFDILRRVMSGYFKYDVLYVMNITDVDDKIIYSARKAHLFSEYKKSGKTLQEVIVDVERALEPYPAKIEKEEDQAKKALLQSILDKASKALEGTKKATSSSSEDRAALIEAAADPLSVWLDSQFGSSLTDHQIFANLTQYWEEEFHRDMAALNVLPPDVITRVTEYIPEVVTYVQKIISNGYGYESNGSVYFDTKSFSSKHSYAKLVPEAVGDLAALQEGEGVLSSIDDKMSEKRSKSDFALWKSSKPGEPSWDSPWGRGRPGWHIECSVMADAILGAHMDIHTGGVDLKFPHHDNEIAQAEAHYEYHQWVNYFLHTGHLTIEGCKMSKSLKNFITIKEALAQYSSRQLRLAFLLHAWGATLDYGQNTMSEAKHIEKVFQEFFLVVKDLYRRDSGRHLDRFRKWGQQERELQEKFQEKKRSIHDALCDSIDTPAVLRHMRELVGTGNTYLKTKENHCDVILLMTVAKYLTDMFKIFGVIPEDHTSIGFPVEGVAMGTQDEVVMPYLNLLAEFRDTVRKEALKVKNVPLLKICDDVRDHQLAELGVRLEDRGETYVIKIVGKEAIMAAREEERLRLEEKKRLKEEQERKALEAKLKREQQLKIPPEEMFLKETDKYSQFDDKGIPTHDAEGKPLSDKQRKKLTKQWQVQEEKHRKYKSSQPRQ
jgi:cysteinyl-tRNA synthetase